MQFVPGIPRHTMFETLEPRRLLAGAGLQAVYYNNANFTGSTVSRVDAKVYFDFAKSPPPSGITPSSYSVRWTGSIQPTTSETYTFYTKSDDGIRLWVNHKLLIDHWASHTLAEATSYPIALSAGAKYDIQIEYWNNANPAGAQLWWSTPTLAKAVVPTARLYPAPQNLKSRIDHAFSFAESQYLKTLSRFGTNYSLYGYASNADGTWSTTGPDAWTSGHFAGSLWQIYAHNTNKKWRLNATAWTRPIGPYAVNPDDIGFRVWNSYFPLACSTKLAADKQVLIAAADAKLKQWNATVGMFRTGAAGVTMASNPAADFCVIIDQSMDMEPLWWAWKETGKTIYRDRATAHLLKLAQSFVRADGSTLQIGWYSTKTGAFVAADVKQGASSSSTWARGQAWAIHAYATAYEQTKNPAFLEIAKKVANYWIARVPADGVPWWDFAVATNAALPGYRDSSAAAIAASGLVQLGKLAPDALDRAIFKPAAEKSLNSLLISGYSAEGKTSPGILLHGAHWVLKNRYVDSTLIYGDYYLLQAMNRYLSA